MASCLTSHLSETVLGLGSLIQGEYFFFFTIESGARRPQSIRAIHPSAPSRPPDVRRTLSDLLARRQLGVSLETPVLLHGPGYLRGRSRAYLLPRVDLCIPACQLTKTGAMRRVTIGAYKCDLSSGVPTARSAPSTTPGAIAAPPLRRPRRAGGQARVPPITSDLRPRRPPDLGPRHGPGFRPGAIQPAPGPPARALRAHLRLPSPTPPPDSTPSPISPGPILEVHDLHRAKVAHTSSIVENGQLETGLGENNRECYHCGGTHPAPPAGPFPLIPTVAGVGRRWLHLAAPPVPFRTAARRGAPARFRLEGFRGQYRFARMPLQENALSYTMDGKAADDARNLGRVGVARCRDAVKFHYPSTWNHFLPDISSPPASPPSARSRRR